ncbi:unnamed protein product [Pedinophyceae sp. YPF-701]|nr:unnamed protein product [Pedinophyceae sp. YPF-701]
MVDLGKILSLAGSIALPVGIGFAGAIWTIDEARGPWYRGLKKPRWNPPNRLFGPVWTVIYTTMGVASWMVARKGGAGAKTALAVYGANLVFNAAWSPLFFRYHKLKIAMSDMVLLWATTAACVTTFRSVSPAASNLMVPYLCWVSFAGVLNGRIMIDNEGRSEDEITKAGQAAMDQDKKTH